MSITTLRRAAASPPDRTASARAELAGRIKEHADTLAEISGMETAMETSLGYTASADAEQRVADAREALDAAKKRESENIINAALSRPLAVGVDAKIAAASLEDAERALADFRNARKEIQQRLWDAQRGIQAKSDAIKDAAKLVVRAHIAPNVDALIEKVNAAYIEAGRLSNLFSWLCFSANAVDIQGADARPRGMEAKCRFESAPFSWADSHPDLSPQRAKWVAAFEALKVDANAPLPAGFE